MKEHKVKCILEPFLAKSTKKGSINWYLKMYVTSLGFVNTTNILTDEFEDYKRGNFIERYFTTRQEAVQYMMSKLKETADTLQEFSEVQKSNLIATIYENGSFSVIGEDVKDTEDE